MTDAPKKRTKHPRMPITVTMSTSDDRVRVPPLMKPTDPGNWANHYDIGYDEAQVVVTVKWGGRLFQPVYLEFLCVDQKITGVGFSECSDGIEKYQTPGPCGGCFFLRTDLRAGSNLAIVENWGHQRENKMPYHFGLWLKNGQIHSKKFDPQIYNDGTIHQPPPRRKKAGG